MEIQTPSPGVHQRLLKAIGDHPKIQSRVGLIIELCCRAVNDLSSLDDALYRAFGARPTARSRDDQEVELRRTAQVVFEGTRGLTSYLGSLEFSGQEAAGEDSSVDSIEFELGPEVVEEIDISLDDDDIFGALGALAPAAPESAKERWAWLSGELTSLAYALGRQLGAFEERFEQALPAKRFEQALRDLDDVCNALTDGVFALMSVIFETYLEKVDRNELVPGHKDALGKALLVRRGLADLRRQVQARNPLVQKPPGRGASREEAYAEIVQALKDFFETRAFTCMRSTDRAELEHFHAQMKGESVSSGKVLCEGLDKYLDSLMMVNQRDVLLRHDKELAREINELLEGVEPLFHISPRGACDLVRGAFEKAHLLYGSSDALDELLREWRDRPKDLGDAEAFIALGRRLASVTR